jgi:hypothetical protein
LPPLKDPESSFEVNWSLSELENIVYEFINSPMELPKEFMQPIPGNSKIPWPKDVTRADLFEIKTER